MSDDEDAGRYFHHVNLWIDDRGLETLEYLRKRYGSTISGALRAGLEIIRREAGLDKANS